MVTPVEYIVAEDDTLCHKYVAPIGREHPGRA